MIKINGKYIRNIPEQVGKNKRDIFQLDTDLSALEVKVNEALAGVFHYKGSVATYTDLPSSDNEVGDVYNVLDTGKNYAWDGSDWDDLGGLVDLSSYYTKSETDTLLAGKAGLATANTFTQDQTLKGNLNFDTTQTYYGIIKKTAAGITIGTNVQDMLKFSGYGMYAISGYAPDVNNSIDLGSSSNAWKDLYLAGKAILSEIDFKNADANLDCSLIYNQYSRLSVKIGTSYPVEFRADSIYYRVSNLPVFNNEYDLGSSSLAWKDLYLAGNLSNGTDSVTVEDLAALITYAKAQGWIS